MKTRSKPRSKRRSSLKRLSKKRHSKRLHRKSRNKYRSALSCDHADDPNDDFGPCPAFATREQILESFEKATGNYDKTEAREELETLLDLRDNVLLNKIEKTDYMNKLDNLLQEEWDLHDETDSFVKLLLKDKNHIDWSVIPFCCRIAKITLSVLTLSESISFIFFRNLFGSLCNISFTLGRTSNICSQFPSSILSPEFLV